MNEVFCTYDGDRDAALIAYLYNDVDRLERSVFESHLATCAACRRELEALDGVRARLARWSPPDWQEGRRPRTISGPQAAGGGPSVVTPRRWWDEVPAWARVAAAVLCLGVGAGAANLTVRYDHQGLSVRTGWMSSGRAASEASAVPAQPAPWRADLTKLEQQLRADLDGSGAAALRTSVAAEPSQTSAREADLVRQVKALVEANAKKQQSELALRVAQVARDVQAQRLADLANIDRRLGLIQNNTGFQVARQNEVINSLAVRVSQTR